MKEKKKLDFVGFWKGFNKTENLFYDILKERYDIEITDKPDFVIASCLGKPLEYLKYDCVRILFTGEPLAPDFNVFDYAIGFDHLSFPDETVGHRYYRFPYCFYSDNKALRERFRKLGDGIRSDEARGILAEKKYFCNFIYGHPSAKGEREQILELVQQHKEVISAGSFKNNKPDGSIVSRHQKPELLKASKFTISCESISYPGFVTEKIVDPFLAASVPIYYGNPLIGKDFNEAAMVNLHRFDSIQEGIESLMELDQDDDRYLQMLMQPKLTNPLYYQELYDGLKDWLLCIMTQTKETAFRRMRHYIQKEHETRLDEYRRFYDSLAYKLYKRTHR